MAVFLRVFAKIVTAYPSPNWTPCYGNPLLDNQGAHCQFVLTSSDKMLASNLLLKIATISYKTEPLNANFMRILGPPEERD